MSFLPSPPPHPCRYVVWNADMSQVALLSKHAIIIADKKLQNAQTVHEVCVWGGGGGIGRGGGTRYGGGRGGHGEGEVHLPLTRVVGV